MTVIRNILVMCLRSALAGGVLGLVIPFEDTSAGCRCSDDKPLSIYKCSQDHSFCTAGGETCSVTCS
jgi:hypothetical protein